MYIYQTMSNNFGYIDIILLGMIAGFIILRLRNILGRKTGHEPKIYPDFTKNLVCLKGNLSPSEIKICMCIKMSYSNIQIKEHMKISDSTLANSRSNIRKKMRLRRAQSLTNSILCI